MPEDRRASPGAAAPQSQASEAGPSMLLSPGACLGTAATAADSSSPCFVSWTRPPGHPAPPSRSCFSFRPSLAAFPALPPGSQRSPGWDGQPGFRPRWRGRGLAGFGGVGSPGGAGQLLTLRGRVWVPTPSPEGTRARRSREQLSLLGTLGPPPPRAEGAWRLELTPSSPSPGVLAWVPESSYNGL